MLHRHMETVEIQDIIMADNKDSLPLSPSLPLSLSPSLPLSLSPSLPLSLSPDPVLLPGRTRSWSARTSTTTTATSPTAPSAAQEERCSCVETTTAAGQYTLCVFRHPGEDSRFKIQGFYCHVFIATVLL